MQRGHLVGYRFTERTDDLLHEFEGGGHPPGSDQAKQAILNVQAQLAEKRRQPLHLKRGRFVSKTAVTE